MTVENANAEKNPDIKICTLQHSLKARHVGD